jgi:hypothetical protein
MGIAAKTCRAVGLAKAEGAKGTKRGLMLRREARLEGSRFGSHRKDPHDICLGVLHDREPR